MDIRIAGHVTTQVRGRAKGGPSSALLDAQALHLIDAWWRAANYLSVGQLYLRANPLLREPLTLDHIKPLIVGHWGTTPGQTFIYAHLNRVIRSHDLDMIYIAGPGHGGPALVGSTYLEGSYSEFYPAISRDEVGLAALFRQFSYPGGISSHVAPTTPGSIHEGGELGYSLSHAFGAAFDNPGLIVACVIGDGEAETGPLATAWQSNKFLSPITDGAVLPILHLNGYKISNPSLLARIEGDELAAFLEGCGWSPRFVEGSDPAEMHQRMAAVMDCAIADIRTAQDDARSGRTTVRPRWPVIVLRSPKGWTGPHEVDGVQIEGTFRSHQVPLLVNAEHPEHVEVLEAWLKSYRPEELFDESGRLVFDVAALAPVGERRMGANRHANGGMLLQDLRLPEFRNYALAVPTPGAVNASDMGMLGPWLRDVLARNQTSHNMRLFGPDETLSNMLSAVFEVTSRQWDADEAPGDEFLAASGMVQDAMLSEHQCQGWLEGYLLTGRHGIFASYEAFVRIVDSMAGQHAKWLKVASELPWRADIASLNYILTSHVWQQDHNGFTHQDPGFLDCLMSKKAAIVRAYLPPDANCLLAVTDAIMRTRQQINVVIAGKHPMPQWLDIEAAAAHCAAGIGVWDWASNDEGEGANSGSDTDPDVVLACCGDTPTLEALAAVSILRVALPELRVRVVNVVDLMTLRPATEHPHGLTDEAFDALFTRDRPVIFAFHGYPALVDQLTSHRTNRRILVRGYQEEGTITTPFDIRVQNHIDRFHLVMDVITEVPKCGTKGAALGQAMHAKLAAHTVYISAQGQDLPEVRNWVWQASA